MFETKTASNPVKNAIKYFCLLLYPWGYHGCFLLLFHFSTFCNWSKSPTFTPKKCFETANEQKRGSVWIQTGTRSSGWTKFGLSVRSLVRETFHTSYFGKFTIFKSQKVRTRWARCESALCDGGRGIFELWTEPSLMFSLPYLLAGSSAIVGHEHGIHLFM